MSRQIVSGVVLGSGELKVTVHQIKEGSSQHYLYISNASELEGFALHATAKQLETIYEGLCAWKDTPDQNDAIGQQDH